MEFLILGLLVLSPMTGYEIQQFIRQNLSLICSHSAGSVQTALKKLEKDVKITTTESFEGNRKKKTFEITEVGRRSFERWVSQPMQADKVKNMELSHLFFLGIAKPQERAEAIRAYILQIKETRTVLTSIRTRFRTLQANEIPAGADWPDILLFQGYTIDYGIAAADFEVQWYSQLLSELEEDR